MARKVKEAGSVPPDTERRVILLSSFLERPNRRCRLAVNGGGSAAEPRRMVMLAEQAHQADQIEQAEKLIEKVYAIYDERVPITDGIASRGIVSTSPLPSPVGTTISAVLPRRPPLR